MPRHRIIALSALIVLFTMTACEDRRADKAYIRGDYDSAVRDLQFLAQGGEARAQYDLGVLYDKGQGVPQSDAQALQWYERAAEQGEPRAQYNLGLMHLNGQGVAPDMIKAYFWTSLSASHGDRHALDARDYIGEKMSVEQVNEGKRLVHEYEEKVEKRKSCILCNLFTGKPAP